MKNKVRHFDIHIDDIERVKKIYDGFFESGFNSDGKDDKPTKAVGKTISKIKNK